MLRLPLLLLTLGLATAASSAQDDGRLAGQLVFTTVGAGGTTGPGDDPYSDVYPSMSLDHVRVRGWQTLRVGGSVQGDVLGSDGYAGIHAGLGATTLAGPLGVSITAGPSVGTGMRGVYGRNVLRPEASTAVRVASNEGIGVGLRAAAQVFVVLVPEVGFGLEATHDRNTFLPTSGARVFFSLGTHRRSLVRL